MTKERPILFSGPMVRAILSGQKTQTRRVISPQPHAGVRRSPFVGSGWEDGHGYELRCPWLVDRLWAREKWGSADRYYQCHENDTASVVAYAADRQAIRWQASPPSAIPDYDIAQWNWDVMKWKPSIHMPRWASRISLEVVGVRVQRLQDISEEDAKAEGIALPDCSYMGRCNSTSCPRHRVDAYRYAFAELWDKINGKRYPWDSNPWVWVISFRRVI